MDPATIAAGVVVLLSPYVKKSVEAFAGEAGKLVFKKTEELFTWIKSKFTGEAASTLGRFEKDPERYAPFLEDILAEHLQRDPKLLADLAGIMEEIKKEAPTLNVVIKMKEAENVTAVRIKNMSRGTANASVDIEKGKNIVGAEVDNM